MISLHRKSIKILIRLAAISRHPETCIVIAHYDVMAQSCNGQESLEET